MISTFFFFFPRIVKICEITDSQESGMNPVATTIINPGKEYWLSQGLNQRPPVRNATDRAMGLGEQD